jgi:O-antigen/teichoic acid export membrane protein
MTPTRTQRSAWNLVSGLLMAGAPLIGGLLATPWTLRWLGAERFGAYRVLTEGFGYITVLELGIVGAVTARLGSKLATGDEPGVRTILAAGFRVCIEIAAAMLAAGALLIIPLPHWIHLHTVSARELRTAAGIMLIPILWMPFSVFRALPDARQQGYIFNVIVTFQLLSTTALLMLAAWLGWGLIGQASATTLALAPIAIVMTVLALRHYPGVLSATPDRNAIQDLRALNWPTLWFNVSSRLGLLSDNIVVSCILGPLAVVPFFLTQRLAQLAQVQLQSIGSATWAGLVQLHAQGETEKFCSRLMELTALVSGLGVVVLGPIAAYNRHFILLWVGSASYAGEWVNAMACINLWIWAIFSLWCWPISGSGRIAAWLPYAIAFSAINIIVSVIATYLAGLPGPLIGTLIAFMAVHCWALPQVLGRLFHRSLRSIWKPAITPLAWGLPYSVGLWVVARSHTPRGWLGLAVETSAALLGGLFLWWLSLGPVLRQEWHFRFRSALALGSPAQ